MIAILLALGSLATGLLALGIVVVQVRDVRRERRQYERMIYLPVRPLIPVAG